MKAIKAVFVLLFVIASCVSFAGPFEENAKVSVDTSAKAGVSTANTNAAKATEKEPVSGTVAVDALRIRSYPWGPVIGMYNAGTPVSVIGREGEFYKVSINGVVGYMHVNYISAGDTPATMVEPYYPGNTRSGGYIARSSGSSGSSGSVKNYASTGVKGGELYDPSVIGARQGNGTVAGAITWAKDQMASGTKRGVNRNNGLSCAQSTKAWSGWCLAFIGTAWSGANCSELCAASAIKSYYKFNNAGKIHKDRNPPAGAVMFTGTTPNNPYGHIFMATGEHAANGDPIVVTSWSGYPRTMTLTKMIGNLNYLGWAMPI